MLEVLHQPKDVSPRVVWKVISRAISSLLKKEIQSMLLRESGDLGVNTLEVCPAHVG
jgi:hypothetical protein